MKPIAGLLLASALLLAGGEAQARQATCEELVALANGLDRVAVEIDAVTYIEGGGYVDNQLGELTENLLYLADAEQDLALTESTLALREAWEIEDLDYFLDALDAVIEDFSVLYYRDC